MIYYYFSIIVIFFSESSLLSMFFQVYTGSFQTIIPIISCLSKTSESFIHYYFHYCFKFGHQLFELMLLFCCYFNYLCATVPVLYYFYYSSFFRYVIDLIIEFPLNYNYYFTIISIIFRGMYIMLIISSSSSFPVNYLIIMLII